jgi:hypothetical protein
VKSLKGDCRDAFMGVMGNTRNAPTTPPPPAMVEAEVIEARALELQAFAQRILDRSSEMLTVARAMRRAR